MDSFKEAYQDDLDNAFFDEDEFADKHTIDGEECVIILTDVTSAAASYSRAKSAINPKETAVNKISHVIYIRDTEVKKLKRKKFTSGAMISLDGKNYFVQDVKYSAGVYRLEIGIHAV